MPLNFVGNTQFVENNLDKKRTEIPAIRTTNGTYSWKDIRLRILQFAPVSGAIDDVFIPRSRHLPDWESVDTQPDTSLYDDDASTQAATSFALLLSLFLTSR